MEIGAKVWAKISDKDNWFRATIISKEINQKDKDKDKRYCVYLI